MLKTAVVLQSYVIVSLDSAVTLQAIVVREIASFYAHVTHETGHFCYIKEIDGPSKDYYNENATHCPCNPTKGYFSRGPIQLSWNSNHRPAGTAISFDGLNFG
ncbi:hypothetical protein F2Q69_00015314 [Brassica cretica]|uniref:Glycoside hydrolase family 19 catalytic domain-containing protein n=1 Tax=Brassica cretica TaxID=69181 RepID=A0A8S9QTZ9_BRACR|nr:hypothetical protein F2Q69_00015314 [Brassica cretica]